ncbi:hypothetical protein HOV43_gp118 [Escherichia phage vB_EcoM_KWBSE43-6]|uniref:Lipoprotein n=1 Tax=Escherichia phage vB_EcoM_KWBSE43-6 TaxID=2508194 RepID=A0A482MZ33_9CAUD|nr:hypothetical protein HOV43_gp118 [Escherichia phage vB_EcoM_KWBSE43-6]QBQ78946.1 hypothetical protein KWBSE43_00118 [Escherichia phage vB_EcoM_KWBSE43-6]
MKLNKTVLFYKIMLAFTLSVSLSACSALLDTPDLSGPDFTQDQAQTKMDDMVKAHAALQGTTPGPIQTVCNYDDSDPTTELYHCSTFVKDSMVVLYGDCQADGCKATGYDKVEEDK